MKTVLIVYGISYAILLVAFIVALIRNREGVKRMKAGFKWYYALFLILLAPLVIVVVILRRIIFRMKYLKRSQWF